MVRKFLNLGLDDILEDNAYQPSFLPREPNKKEPIRPKTSNIQVETNKSFKN